MGYGADCYRRAIEEKRATPHFVNCLLRLCQRPLPVVLGCSARSSPVVVSWDCPAGTLMLPPPLRACGNHLVKPSEQVGKQVSRGWAAYAEPGSPTAAWRSPAVAVRGTVGWDGNRWKGPAAWETAVSQGKRSRGREKVTQREEREGAGQPEKEMRRQILWSHSLG